MYNPKKNEKKNLTNLKDLINDYFIQVNDNFNYVDSMLLPIEPIINHNIYELDL